MLGSRPVHGGLLEFLRHALASSTFLEEPGYVVFPRAMRLARNIISCGGFLDSLAIFSFFFCLRRLDVSLLMIQSSGHSARSPRVLFFRGLGCSPCTLSPEFSFELRRCSNTSPWPSDFSDVLFCLRINHSFRVRDADVSPLLHQDFFLEFRRTSR